MGRFFVRFYASNKDGRTFAVNKTIDAESMGDAMENGLGDALDDEGLPEDWKPEDVRELEFKLKVVG